jgi:hypothetical protein
MDCRGTPTDVSGVSQETVSFEVVDLGPCGSLSDRLPNALSPAAKMWPMQNVCVLCVWKIAQPLFAAWFTAGAVVANFVVVRLAVRTSFARTLALDGLISGLSWLLIVAVPLPLYAYAITWKLLLHGRDDPFSWTIPVFLSTLTGALSGITVLRVFKEKAAPSVFWWLVAANLIGVSLAVQRMAAYVLLHPPEA